MSMWVYVKMVIVCVCVCTGGSPRCYDASDPQLNSTNWLVSYIGVFISYVTLSDLNSFVSSNQVTHFDAFNQSDFQMIHLNTHMHVCTFKRSVSSNSALVIV